MRAIAVIALLLLAGTNASGKKPESVGQIVVQRQEAPAPEQQHSESNVRESYSTPLEVHVTKTHSESKEDTEDRNEHANVDWWTIRIGVLTFLILCVQAGVFWKQAARLRESVEEMKTATKATESVTATLVTNNRPWLSFQPKLGAFNVEGDSFGLHIDLIVKNVGNSPAKQVVELSEIITNDGFNSESLASMIESYIVPAYASATRKSSLPTLFSNDSETFQIVQMGKIPACNEVRIVCGVGYQFEAGEKKESRYSAVLLTIYFEPEMYFGTDKPGPFKIDSYSKSGTYTT